MQLKTSSKDMRGAMTLSFFMSLITCFIIGIIIQLTVKNQLDYDAITKLFFLNQKQFVAENSERLQYMTTAVLFPTFYLIYLQMYKTKDLKIILKIEKFLSAVMYFFIIFMLIYGVVVYVCEFILLIDTKQLPSYSFYCYAALTFILLAAFFTYKKSKSIKSRINSSFRIIFKFEIVVTVLLIFILNIFYDYSTQNFLAFHFDAYYFPIGKALAGLVQGIDFHSIYGYYSYFYYIPMKLLGFLNNDKLSFLLINSLLLSATFINLVYICSKLLKNKILKLVSVPSIAFSVVFLSCFCSGGPYFQYQPHRVLFPSIIALLIYKFYTRSKTSSSAKFIICGIVVSACSLIWNIDSGVVTTVAFVSAIGYDILCTESLKKPKTILKCIYTIFYAVISVALAIGSLLLVTYIRTGNIAEIISSILGQNVFYRYGYYMLRMDLFGLWNIVAIAYAIGLAVSIKKLYMIRGKSMIPDATNGMLFSLSIIGVGVFSYFQGRSHANCLLAVIWPAVIIGFIIYDNIKSKNTSNALFISSNKKLSSLFFQLLIIILLLSFTISITNVFLTSYKTEPSFKNAYSLIDRVSEEENKEFEFISFYESSFYNHYNKKNSKKAIPPVECMLRTDFEQEINYILTSKDSIAIDLHSYKLMNAFVDNQFADLLLRNDIKIIDESSNGWYFLIPQK